MGNTGFIWDGIGWNQETDDDSVQRPGAKHSVTSYVRRHD